MSGTTNALRGNAGVSNNRATNGIEETKCNDTRLPRYQSIRMLTKIPIDDHMTKFAWQRI